MSAEGVGRRMDTIKMLEDGWHEGGGKAVSMPAIYWSGKQLINLVDRAIAPSIYPTLHGSILAEWESEDWSISAEFRYLMRDCKIEIVALWGKNDVEATAMLEDEFSINILAAILQEYGFGK